MKAALSQSLGSTPLRGTWYRAVDPRFLPVALSASHTRTTPSRFSPGSTLSPAFEVLYLAENPMVALFEARALFGSPSTPGGVVPHPGRPLVTLPIMVSLTAVADLTDPAEAHRVQTNAQELTGDWHSYSNRILNSGPDGPHHGTPPTQSLGNALFTLGIHQGLVTFSARLPDYKILAVFTDRIKGTANYLQYSFHDSRGALQVKRIP